MAKKYDESAVQSLDALSHIRLRPGMYIGRLGDGSHPDDGIYVMLKEAIDNSVDEFIMGHGKRIEIGLDERGAVLIIDAWSGAHASATGRGRTLDEAVAEVQLGLRPPAAPRTAARADQAIAKTLVSWQFADRRDGLEWHDGKLVTAEDCIASLKRWSARDAMGQKMAQEFTQYKSQRHTLEQKWLKNLRQYLGIYDPDVEQQLPANRSRAYPRITRVKCISVLSRLINLMFPGNERNWELRASPSPEMDPADVEAAVQAMVARRQKDGLETPIDEALIDRRRSLNEVRPVLTLETMWSFSGVTAYRVKRSQLNRSQKSMPRSSMISSRHSLSAHHWGFLIPLVMTLGTRSHVPLQPDWLSIQSTAIPARCNTSSKLS